LTSAYARLFFKALPILPKKLFEKHYQPTRADERNEKVTAEFIFFPSFLSVSCVSRAIVFCFQTASQNSRAAAAIFVFQYQFPCHPRRANAETAGFLSTLLFKSNLPHCRFSLAPSPPLVKPGNKLRQLNALKATVF
jgi:hypothetical protein